jgi:hypothetical protein
MSPTDEGTFTDDATLANLVEEASTTTREGDTSKLDDADLEAALATFPWPPQPVSPARIAVSEKAHHRPYDDPSNYLG